MSTITDLFTSSRRATKVAAAAIATAATVATVLAGAPSAHASTTSDPCAALATGGSCTITDTNGQFESVAIPYNVDTITAIVAGAGGPHSQAPMHGGWTTVGTFMPNQLGHELQIRVGRITDGNGAGGDTVITNGQLATSKVLVDSAGGSIGNGYSDVQFDRMAAYPNLGGTGSVTLIAQSAIDLTGNDSFTARSLPIPTSTHHFRVFMAGGAGSRGHNGAFRYGDGAVITGTVDTGNSNEWQYNVGESAYDGGYGFSRPGQGGSGLGHNGKNGGDGGGDSMLIGVNRAGARSPLMAAGGGGGAGGDSCGTFGSCDRGGRGGTAGGSGDYSRNGTAGSGGAPGGRAGDTNPADGIHPDGGQGQRAYDFDGTIDPSAVGGGGGGGAGYPHGGQGGLADGSDNHGGGGGGGAGASWADPASTSEVSLTTTASCTDGYIIIIPIV